MKKRKIAILISILIVAVLTMCSCTTTETTTRVTQNPIKQIANMAKAVKNEQASKPKQTDNSELLNSPLSLPATTTTQSNVLAKKALALCTSAEYSEEMFEKAELTTLKCSDQATKGHTATYRVGTKTTSYNGSERKLFVIALYPTNGDEMYSNFDFAPSHKDSNFAENFLLAATDVYNNTKSLWNDEDSPLFLVCGYGRGAGVANLLATFLNEDGKGGENNVFAYTFGSPATIKSGLIEATNVFNYINDGDVVTKIPMKEWGYERVGKDVALSTKDESTKSLAESFVNKFLATVENVDDYYNGRYSLTSNEKSEKGVTAYELALMVAAATNSENLTGENLSLFDNIGDCHYKTLFDFILSLQKVDILKLYNQHSADSYQTLISNL